ncbi:hypothetical protein D3C75_595740 [compost metagenome]
MPQRMPYLLSAYRPVRPFVLLIAGRHWIVVSKAQDYIAAWMILTNFSDTQVTG